MLTAIPKSMFSWNFTVYDGDATLADLDVSWFRERGSFMLASHTFHVLRTSMVGGEFQLRCEDLLLAEAKKTSPFLRCFNLRVDGRVYAGRAKTAGKLQFGHINSER
jgi:hypothetical protein